MTAWTTEGACIMEDGEPVGFFHTLEAAEQVARDHNSRSELVDVIRSMYDLANDGSASFDDPSDDSPYLKAAAILEAEK